MNKIKRFLKSPAATLLGFAVAAGLLLFSTVGGVNAALLEASDYYGAEMSVKYIGVQLNENDKPVSHRNFYREGDYEHGEFEDKSFWSGKLELMGDSVKVVPGKAYKEELSVTNSGEINEYVRVTIYKYWLEPKILVNGKEVKEPKKDNTVWPGLIQIGLANTDDWYLDKASSTPERMVLYYRHRLDKGKTTSVLTKTLAIDGSIMTEMHEETKDDGKTIIHRYEYNGRQFVLEAEVDAVQDHHARDAMKSAWGISDDIINKINIQE